MVVLEASKDIEQGSELTLRYGGTHVAQFRQRLLSNDSLEDTCERYRYEFGPHAMLCKCGVASCEGFVFGCREFWQWRDAHIAAALQMA